MMEDSLKVDSVFHLTGEVETKKKEQDRYLTNIENVR